MAAAAAAASAPVPRLLCEDMDAPSFLRHFERLGLTPRQEVRAGRLYVGVCRCASLSSLSSL